MKDPYVVLNSTSFTFTAKNISKLVRVELRENRIGQFVAVEIHSPNGAITSQFFPDNSIPDLINSLQKISPPKKS